MFITTLGTFTINYIYRESMSFEHKLAYATVVVANYMCAAPLYT